MPFHRSARATLVTLIAAACAGGTVTPVASPPPSGLGWGEVLPLRASRGYFALRERVERAERGAGATTPPARFARAVVQHAFNDPAASNATVEALLRDASLPDSVATDLRQIRMGNHLRLFEYRAGLAAADALLAEGAGLDSADRRDALNLRRIFLALADVPPQTAAVRGPTALRLEGGRVPVRVNAAARQYVFDTGANLSTIMRSEATAVGLRIVPAGIDVGTSTARRVLADLGVADSLTLGGVHYRNVVFLVLDDALLTFPGDFRIPGIVGFPVIAAMGEVRIGAGGALSVPATVPVRGERNLAFDGLTPLTTARWGEVPLLCRLDTGASHTQLYEPFYRKARARVDSAARRGTRRVGSAGGMSEIAVRVLPGLRLAVGDTVAALDSVDVLPESIVRDQAENFLDCNLGHDVLDAFASYVINFRDMAFLLR